MMNRFTTMLFCEQAGRAIEKLGRSFGKILEETGMSKMGWCSCSTSDVCHTCFMV